MRKSTLSFERLLGPNGCGTFLHPLLVGCYLILTILRTNAAFAADEPEKLQKQGIERVDRYREHYFQTGERNELLPELGKAEGELKSSYNAFVAKGNFAAAALSEITLGRIESTRSVESIGSTTESQGMKIAAAEAMGKHYEAAFQFYSRARELAQKAKHAGYEAKALMGLARIDGLDRGNISAGADYVTQAIPLAAKAGNKDDLFDALALASELELKRNRLSAADDYLNRALSMSAQIEKKSLVYFAYRDRADIYRNRAEVCTTEPRFGLCYEAMDRARADLRRALALTQEMGYAFLSQDIKRESGELDLLQGAMQRLEAGLKTYASHFSPKSSRDVLVTEHFAVPLSPDQVATMQKFVQQNASINVSPDARSYFVQGELRESEGQFGASLTSYLKAVELLESDRGQLRDEQSRGTFLEDKIDFYYPPIRLLLEQHRLAEAFDLLERSRSRGMADLLNSRPLDVGTAPERELFSQSEVFRAKIGADQQKLFRYTTRGSPEKYTEEISGLQADIKKLEEQDQDLAVRIAKEAPRLKQLTVSRAVTLQSAQRLAQQENCDLLYYLVLPTNVFVWHISGADVEVLSVFLPRAFLIDKVSRLRDSLTARARNENAQFDEQTSRELFLYLIQPILKSIKTHHLVIVPHEDLNYVPFQVLQDPADRTYLGEKFQVSYAPSVTVLASLEGKPNIAGGRLLAVAPTMEAARGEVKAIGNLYPGRSKVVTDVAVKKSDIKKWSADYNLLHLSVHGRFEESDPLLSYLELNPAEEEEGRLTAAEMFGLPLPKNSLVVLSACETGRVMATHANELLGMQRALLYAGASELVLSSWEVNAESTAFWMETFYREAQTHSPSEAARLALVAVKARPEYRHPYYWSAFLLTGK